ncbi:MAG: CarD family transcriptional regulator [Anaerolineales bacterium]
MSGAVERISKGDWIFHPTHGIGHVKKIEKKRIEGKKTRFFRVEQEYSTYWLPIEEIESSGVRRLASRAQFRRAVQLLCRAPRDMDPNYKKRQSRIRKIMSRGSLRGVVRVIRDLWARQQKNGLSYKDKRALSHFIDNLVEEWSFAEEISNEDARLELYDLLKNGSFSLEEAGARGQLREVVKRG